MYVFSQKFLFITEKYSNWQGVGQNVARDIARGVAGKVDVHKLIGHWFNQILYFDPEAVKSFGYIISLFRNKKFVLNKMFQRNASKFSIFYV